MVSDRLGFEVCGGLYPKQLNSKRFESLAKYREGEEGTIIKLPLLSAAKDEICQHIQRQGSGKGIDAPPLGNILGIGQTFIVRELLRAGILTSSTMHPYAYVPVRRVRGILQAIGCQGIREGGEDRNIANSNRIYEFLVKHLGEKDATFCGDYDLPFLMLDQESDYRKKEILGLP